MSAGAMPTASRSIRWRFSPVPPMARSACCMIACPWCFPSSISRRGSTSRERRPRLPRTSCSLPPMLPSEIIDRFRVHKGSGFRLADFDCGDTCGLDIEKKDAKDMLEAGVKRLSKLQERLYAEGRWAVLAVLQGLDTSGKDGVIKHVLSGVNPQGCEVHSFKAPSTLELAHDLLWRTTIALPGRGRIGIFNRSYYEETVVVRVHPELLERQHLPQKLVTDEIWKQRYEDINNFELHLARNGVVPIKFFLNISKGEQLKRLLARA